MNSGLPASIAAFAFLSVSKRGEKTKKSPKRKQNTAGGLYKKTALEINAILA